MEIRKDQFTDLIGKFGKHDVLDVVPWNRVEAADFEDSGIAGTCSVYVHSDGDQRLRSIKVQHDADALEKLLILLHEAAHYRTTVNHDARFAAVCWGLVFRARLAGLADRRTWDEWTRSRAWYDIQDEPTGASWARAKAEQLACSGPIMFRVRLWRLGFSAPEFARFALMSAGVLSAFAYVASH